MVGAATGDPTTPIDQGESVYGRLADAHFVRVDGGRHVMFGRGVACVDEAVAAFLVTGEGARETACAVPFEDAYVPLTPRTARAFAAPVDAASALETELFALV